MTMHWGATVMGHSLQYWIARSTGVTIIIWFLFAITGAASGRIVRKLRRA
jgi:hypothetical protein